MSLFTHLNDGSNHAPRLRVGHTLWGLSGLPMNSATEWTLDEKFSRVKHAGFSHVECWVTPESAPEIKSTLERHNLLMALGHRPNTVSETRKVVELAANCGAEFVLCQPATAYHSLSEVAEIVRAGASEAADKGLHYFVETHRNNFTETIPQTLALIDAVPEILITADFSHFVVVGEFYGWDGEGALERMQPIIDRVAHVHGRISNGEQIQVDVADGSTDPARFFVRLWAACFQAWRKRAHPGDILPFSAELGPPRYAITLPDGREFSDRWEQSLVLKKLAEEAWQL